MICPGCKAGPARTLKTMEVGLLTHRNHLCARCAARWTSEQRPLLETLVVTNSHGPPKDAAISDQGAEQIPQKSGGKGVSYLSDPAPLLPFFSADPDPALSLDPGGDRARGSLYSQAFTDCWRAYGRKEGKAEAFQEWNKQARLMGGEGALRGGVLDSLVWQGPVWAADGWKFAPYFVRYLSRQRWEDEPRAVSAPLANQKIVDVGNAWLNKRGGSK